MSLSPQVLQAAPAASAYCVAYSGGMDSTVLLHLACAAQLPGLGALHVHHGLQDSADDWAGQCAAQCDAWQVPLQVLRVSVDAQHPQGPEAAARAARYAALQAHMPKDAVLLTAHHAGDQAETVLLRLLRGTGVEGLAAMPITTPLGASGLTLWRPLLRVSRDALRQYAEQHALCWIEDPHNSDPQYARSWLRSNVMPRLHSRWPDADAQLARAAEHAADAATLLTGLAETLLLPLCRDDGLSVSGLLALKPAERRLVLRHWLAARRLPVPFASTLQQLERDVLRAQAEAMPLLRWPGIECRRYRDVLYASAPLPPLPEDFTATWDGKQPLQLPAGYGVLHAMEDFAEPVQVRFAQGGERIRPKNDAHTRSLRYLAQQAGVPPWLRPRLPLVFLAGQLVSVAGRWNSATAMQLCWQAPDFHGLPLSWRQRFTNN
ncbi:MAG: tRNA lysidine(34) synthetase TilS [Stagnimonas sp.]|nr:tRNA lysidine(34) synthetase TilS [Stagnimonas sp.]